MNDKIRELMDKKKLILNQVIDNDLKFTLEDFKTKKIAVIVEDTPEFERFGIALRENEITTTLGTDVLDNSKSTLSITKNDFEKEIVDFACYLYYEKMRHNIASLRDALWNDDYRSVTFGSSLYTKDEVLKMWTLVRSKNFVYNEIKEIDESEWETLF